MIKRRKYRRLKVMLVEWSELAERLTCKYAVLFGLERVGGYQDCSGNYFPPAYNVHCDGFCFRVDSVPSAVSLLQGFDAGMDFNLSKGAGRGAVSRGEVDEIVRLAILDHMSRQAAAVADASASATSAP